jgi:glycosyltransferase involved in cell wall biosynthesis
MHKKILYVNHVGLISGAERVLQNLIARLNRAEFEPVIAIPESGKLFTELTNQGMKVYPIQTPLLIRTYNPVKLCRYIIDFYKVTKRLNVIIIQENISLLHANSFSAHLYSILAAKITKRPIIWHMHDIITPRWFNKPVVWFAGKMANKIVAVSNAVRDSLLKFGIAEDKIQTVYNGMDCEISVPTALERQQIRNEFAISDHTVVITMVGAITPWKGQHILLQTAVKLASSIPSVRYLLIGDILLDSDKVYQQNLLNIVKQNQLESQIVFTGFRSDVSKIMAASDIIVHSSVKPDPLPTVILEAMALKKPVIAARIGGVPEIIESGITGLLFIPENVTELATAVNQLVINQNMRERIGEAARKRIEQSFNIIQNIFQIESIYRQLVR